MTQEDDTMEAAKEEPKASHASRPSLVTQQSSSAPSSPRHHARDKSRARTPSPPRRQGKMSPRSVSSESAMPSASRLIPTCRYQSTQTNRRRMKYTIGADALEPEKEELKKSLGSSEERKLTKDMNALYSNLLPSPESQASRQKVAEKLKNILQEEWPTQKIDVSVFGSSGNLLNTSKSDVDICISIKSLDYVCSLADVLARRGMKNVTCVHAKAVPIVKIWDSEYQMACDLNVNNHVALKNTRMVRTYMELDERVRPLALIIKYWTKQRIINEASGGTLSSYTWTLLVIHFLQTRSVPILPVLAIHDAEGRQKQDFDADLERFRDCGSANKESLGELLFHFFRHYGHEVDYDNAVMSVRAGKILTKKEKNWHLATNNRLCVEEPFNTDRNLGNTADDTAFRGLHLELRQAFSRIADGKDLESSVCEQYEFPPDEPKTIFERPQAGPRPILSRSTSQSGRGGRRSGRGNRGGGYDYRSGGRRSSSAAAYGHAGAAIPGMQSPGLLMPGSEYFYGAGMPMFSPADLESLARQIDQKQQQLRMKQMHIHQAQMAQAQAQAQAHAQAQAQAMVANQQRSSSASTPLQQYPRLHGSGFPSPHLQASDLAPGSAPLTAPYPYTTSAESSVPMSHSSSAQDGNTNPNSPMLAPSTPHRRGLHRGVQQVSSAGAAVRSQSQPARTIPQNAIPNAAAAAARSPYGQLGAQQQSAFPMNTARPFYLGPYMGPYGSYYFAAPSTESHPREYVGYGIGGAPQFASPLSEVEQVQIPPYEELVRQGRQISPSRRHSTMPMTSVGVKRSPSPDHRQASEGQADSVSSPTASTYSDNQYQLQSSVKGPSEDRAPMIVNGSYYSSVPRTTQAQEVETRRVSEPARRPTFGSDHASEEPIHRTQSNQSFAARVGASIAASEKARRDAQTTGQKPNFLAGDDLESQKRSGPSKSKAISSTEMPPPPRPSENRSPSTRKSPEATNGSRKPNGSRGPIPPLDLGISYGSTAERLRDTQPHLLSPVEERRTPSPGSARKASNRNSLPANGLNGMASSFNHLALRPDKAQTATQGFGNGTGRVPPAPTPLSHSENTSRHANGSAATTQRAVSPTKGQSGRGRPLSQIILPSETNLPTQNVPQQNFGIWQQAGKAKKNKKNKGGSVSDGDKKAGGQPMPENAAERKGG